MLGISTCYWSDRSFTGDEIINHILDLGIKGIELEYRLTNSIYQEMKPRLNKDVQVLSIHNFFPRPDDRLKEKASGDLFLLSSLDSDERAAAVKYAIKTIEQANDLEVVPVILHLGRVDMPTPIASFRELYHEGKFLEKSGSDFLNEQIYFRNEISQKHLDAVFFSLDKLNREAEKHGVLLGIENRYYFSEIPQFKEIGKILETFSGGHLRYWHDIGHAVIQDNLGLTNHIDFLNAYSNHMIGMHVHDVKDLIDHLSPGQGDVNFEEIKSFVKPEVVKILEIDSDRSKMSELQEGIEFFKQHF